MAIKLYKHNKTAYEEVVKAFEYNNKVCVVHPTGTGKTYIAFKLVEENSDKKFVWLGPSEYIYNTQSVKLYRCQGISFENVEFHTYAWLRLNGESIADMNPDYIILDEFHRAGAKKWEINVRKLLSTYTDSKVFGMTATNIRYLDNRRDMACEIFEGNVCSEYDIVEAMARNIIPVPNYVVCSYCYEEKLREYEERIDKIKNKAVRCENKDILERLRRALEQAKGISAIFKKYIEHRNGRYIVFCANIEKMYEMMSMVPEWFGCIDKLPHVYCVHSDNIDSSDDFKNFQEDESEHIKLLFTVDMLNEGVHIDGVAGVILLRPTISPIVYKQQIGRALSTDSEYKPVIFDMVNNFENLYSVMAIKNEYESKRKSIGVRGSDSSCEMFEIVDELRDCRELMTVLLKNLDSTWDMYYEELVKYKKINGHMNIPKNYITEEGLRLGKWLVRERGRYRGNNLTDEKTKKLMALDVEFKAIYDVRFEYWYQKLKEYKSKNGNLHIEGDYETEDGKKLGKFVSRMRSRYRKGELNSEQIDKLNDIGFVWDYKIGEWEKYYKLAEDYFKVHGNLNISKIYKTENGDCLGYWIAMQRAAYYGKKGKGLTKEQKDRLEAVGMRWEYKPKTNKFGLYIKELESYVKKYGNTEVDIGYVSETGVKLGNWMSNVRIKYNAGKRECMLLKDEECPEAYLTIQQEKMLNDLGFIWDVNMHRWDELYEMAKEYYEKYGDFRYMPKDIKSESGVFLKGWIDAQKARYRHHSEKYTKEQLRLLEEIGIVKITDSDRNFEDGVNALRTYKDKYGTVEVKLEYVTEDGFSLGKWCARYRSEYRKGKVKQERVNVLAEIGFVWDVTEYYWNKMYDKAKEWYEENGNLKIPTSFVCEDGAKLGQWISSMRKRKKSGSVNNGNISKDKIMLLDNIEMIW